MDLPKENVEGTVATPAESQGLNQQQVNDIVKREKMQAAERTRREMEAQHREELDRVRAEAAGNQPAAPNQIDPVAIRQQLYEQFMQDLKYHRDELVKQEEEKSLRALADQYHLKMGKGSKLFDDFESVMGDFKPAEFSNTAMLAAQMENTPEIMYELANNPGKLAEIESLAEKSPTMAKKQLERLAKSINVNLEAKQSNVNAPPPLSLVKSSSVGVDSNKMTLKDFKNAPWLKG